MNSDQKYDGTTGFAMRNHPRLGDTMLKAKLLYAVLLAALLTLFFLMGNPTHTGGISAFPWLLAIIPFPVVLTIQLRSAVTRIPAPSFAQLFRLGEATVVFASLLFGIFTFAYFYFYFLAPSTMFLGMGLLLTLLGTLLTGTLFALVCAFALANFAHRRQA